ncbi:MAG TPA: carbonic anhydrase [Pseudomonadales bacterium]|nr:carbonic anhydrase [Pseudomonadales bacterium]
MANGSWPAATSSRRVSRGRVLRRRASATNRALPLRRRSRASVAGNIVAPSQVGSVEFAAVRFGTPLVVVLGHSRCGAVIETLQEIRSSESDLSYNLMSIVTRIEPAVRTLMATELRHDPDALLEHAIRANVRASVDHLRHGSEILEGLIRESKLMVVGAEYSLDTGEVDFFDGA